MLGESSFIDVVRDKRAALMERIQELLDHEAQSYGIQVVDVRIRRADLPEQNSQAVYRRMQTERQREAAEYRAQGQQRAQEIRSQADRQVTVLIANAKSKAEQIRGEGDAKRNEIYAAAYSKDPKFFDFYRSMQAYRTGLKQNDTRYVLGPDSSFFRFFNDPSGKMPAETATPGRHAGACAVKQEEARLGMSDFLAALGLVFVIEGLDLRGLSRPRQEGDAERPGDARPFAADARHRRRGDRAGAGLAGAGGRPRVRCTAAFRANRPDVLNRTRGLSRRGYVMRPNTTCAICP